VRPPRTNRPSSTAGRLSLERARKPHGGRLSSTSGQKIAPMFLRLLRDWTPIQLTHLEDIRIPVDVNVLRATLCSGALRGSYSGAVEWVFAEVRNVWHRATQGLTNTATGKPMIGLDMDGPLWRVGGQCSNRGNHATCPPACPCAPGCVYGNLVIKNNTATWAPNA
jgi:hypothetical protein